MLQLFFQFWEKGTVPFSQNKKFKVIFVVAYGKGTVEVHGGSIVNNGASGRASCVHTSGNGNSAGATVTLDGVTMESKGVAALNTQLI